MKLLALLGIFCLGCAHPGVQKDSMQIVMSPEYRYGSLIDMNVVFTTSLPYERNMMATKHDEELALILQIYADKEAQKVCEHYTRKWEQIEESVKQEDGVITARAVVHCLTYSQEHERIR
jgi:hypothetical protein